MTEILLALLAAWCVHLHLKIRRTRIEAEKAVEGVDWSCLPTEKELADMRATDEVWRETERQLEDLRRRGLLQ